MTDPLTKVCQISNGRHRLEPVVASRVKVETHRPVYMDVPTYISWDLGHRDAMLEHDGDLRLELDS